MSTKKTVSHSSVHFAKVSLLSKIKSRTSKRLLDGAYNYWYTVRKICFACGFAGFQGTKMRDQLSNRPFSTWLTYSPIFFFLFFPSSDLDFLAKIFVKQEIKLVWPYAMLISCFVGAVKNNSQNIYLYVSLENDSNTKMSIILFSLIKILFC